MAESKVDHQKIASEKLGEKAKCQPSEDNTLVLCYVTNEGPNLGGPGMSYFVYDNGKNSIILEDKIDKGTVSWFNNTQLSLFYTPGIMTESQTRDDFTYIYDIATKEKTLKTKL